MDRFSVCDVLKADEIGSYYKLAQVRTISQKRPRRTKVSKDRITVFMCAKADGGEKYELIFLGAACKTGAFRKNTGREHCLDYHANKNAWMKTHRFYEWPQHFDASFNVSGRKILLLLDSCSFHGSHDTLPPLNNFELYFLPPNTDSKLQPANVDIIASFKLRYRKFQMKRTLDLSEEESLADT